VNRVVSSWGPTKRIGWQYGYMGTIFQPSVKTGNRTNLYAKLGVTDFSRGIGDNKGLESSNFGDNSLWGFGLDWKIRKESPKFPLFNINFGLTGNRTKFRSQVWYEIDGTKHERTKNKGETIYIGQIAILASKKVSKYVTLSAGGVAEGVKGEDYEAYEWITKVRAPDTLEEMDYYVQHPPDDSMFIPYDIFHSKDDTQNWKYYAKKYPDYATYDMFGNLTSSFKGGGYSRVYFVSAEYAEISSKVDLPNGGSVVAAIQLGNVFSISLGFTIGF